MVYKGEHGVGGGVYYALAFIVHIKSIAKSYFQNVDVAKARNESPSK